MYLKMFVFSAILTIHFLLRTELNKNVCSLLECSVDLYLFCPSHNVHTENGLYFDIVAVVIVVKYYHFYILSVSGDPTLKYLLLNKKIKERGVKS